jgi:hypothetical protein
MLTESAKIFLLGINQDLTATINKVKVYTKCTQFNTIKLLRLNNACT